MSKVNKIVLCWLLLFLCSRTRIAAPSNWAHKIERLKPTVVNLEVSTQVNLGLDDPGTSYGTGFIVDAKRGIIATNRHITSTSPAHIKITFVDGSSTEGKILFYDYYHDFAFVQFDPSLVALTLWEPTPGSSFDLKPQQTVFLIGNNEREEYSVKIGMVVSTTVDKGTRHSSTIQTTFDRTSGSSGSPVFTEDERVVGIHFSGTDTSSFELPIEYLTDSLTMLQRGKLPQRGDVGLDLAYVNLDDAVKHLGITDYYRDVYKREFPRSTKVIQIQRIIPGSPAQGFLKPGDIIWSVGNRLIGDNLYLFDKLIDQRVNQNVKLIVLRRKKAIGVELPVLDLEAQKTKTFVLFGGGTFQNITATLRRNLNYAGAGVFMNSVQVGSAFSSLGVYNEKNPTARRVIVKELDGREIRDLDDFTNAARSITNGTYTTVIYQDLLSIDTAPKVKYISFDLMVSELRIFQVNDHAGQWEEIQWREMSQKRK